jgi:arginine/ornithine transport system substrate-binding protein
MYRSITKTHPVKLAMISLLIVAATYVAFTIGTLLFCPHFNQAQADNGSQTLRVAVDPNLKPFVYTAPNGELLGIDVAVAREVCKDIGKTCEFVVVAWDGLIPSLASGKVDAIITSMSITEARERVVDFTKPYYKTPSQMLAKAGAGVPTKGAIGTLRGSTDEDYALAKLKPAGLEVITYSNQNEAFLDLLSGRLAAVLGPKVELQAGLLDTERGKGLEFVGATISDAEFYGPGVGMAVKQGNVELLAQLNATIDRIHADGTWRTITDSYLGYDL